MVIAMKSKINQIFLRLSRYFALSFMTLSATVINAYAIDAGDVTHAEGLKRLLMVLAMCKIAQHVDEYLNQLGIGSPHTGGSMLDDIVVAGKTMQSGLNKLTGRGGGGGSGAGGGTLGQVYGGMFRNTLTGGAINEAAKAWNNGASAKDVASAAMRGLQSNLDKSVAGRAARAGGAAVSAFNNYRNGGGTAAGGGAGGVGGGGGDAAKVVAAAGGSDGTDKERRKSSTAQQQKTQAEEKKKADNQQRNAGTGNPVPTGSGTPPPVPGKHEQTDQTKAQTDAHGKHDTKEESPKMESGSTDPGGTGIPTTPPIPPVRHDDEAETTADSTETTAETAPDGTPENQYGSGDEYQGKHADTTSTFTGGAGGTGNGTLHDRWGHVDESGQYVRNDAATATPAASAAQVQPQSAPEPPRTFMGALKAAAVAGGASFVKDTKGNWNADLKNIASGNRVQSFNSAARQANMNGYETNSDIANAKYAQYENAHNSVVDRSTTGDAPVSDDMVEKAQNGTLTSREAVQNFRNSGIGGGDEGPLLTRNAETDELEISREGQAAGCVLVEGPDGQYVTDIGDGRAVSTYLAESAANYTDGRMTESSDTTVGTREIAQYTAEQASVGTCIEALDNQNVPFVDNDMTRYLATKAYGDGFTDMMEGTQFRNIEATDLSPRDDGQGHAIYGGRVFTAEYTAKDGSTKTAMFTSSDATFAISSAEIQQNDLKQYVAKDGSVHWTNAPTDVAMEPDKQGRVVDNRGATNLMHEIQGRSSPKATHGTKADNGAPMKNTVNEATTRLNQRTETQRKEIKQSKKSQRSTQTEQSSSRSILGRGKKKQK